MRAFDLAGTVANEVTLRTLKAGWRLFAAGAIPAALGIGILAWTAEAYVAAMGLRASQAFAVCLGAGAFLALMAIALARMTHLLLSPPRRPAAPMFGLDFGASEARAILALGLFVLAGLALAGLGHLLSAATSSAFFVVGSEGIERFVIGFENTIILLIGLYLLARTSLLVSAAAIGSPGLPAVWAATDQDAGLLLLLIWVLPIGVLAVLAGPILLILGAVPPPAPEDVDRGLHLVAQLRSIGWLLAPLLWLALTAAWSLMAVGLALAHERLLPETLPQGAARTVQSPSE